MQIEAPRPIDPCDFIPNSDRGNRSLVFASISAIVALGGARLTEAALRQITGAPDLSIVERFSALPTASAVAGGAVGYHYDCSVRPHVPTSLKDAQLKVMNISLGISTVAKRTLPGIF